MVGDAEAETDRLVPWLAAPGFLVGLFIADLWPGIGIPLGTISLLLAIALFTLPRAPRWAGWLAAGVASGVVALLLLALLQMINSGATPGAGTGSATAPPR
jgi:hypothetical protein